MTTPTKYDDVADALVANGYEPVPIAFGKKAPIPAQWTSFKHDERRKWPQAGAGINARYVPCADLDIDDEDASAACEQAVRDALGLGDDAILPRRIGRHPRVLLPFRCDVPFPKLRSADYKLRNGTMAHVEILADGQQFVAYGVHATTGKPYTWNGSGDLLSVPRDALPLVDEATARRIVAACEQVLSEYGERVQPVARVNAPAAQAQGDGTIATGGRNDALARLAGKLRRDGLSAEAIEAALQAHNTEHCSPPLSAAEVAGIARSVGRYPTAPDADAPPSDAHDEPCRWPPPLDMVALAQREPEPPRFIIPDWLPEDYATMLAGHGGAGKSGIALYLAACLAFGRPFFGVETQQRRVLYLACEDRENVLHWRLARICAHLKAPLGLLADKLFMQDMVGADSILWELDPRTGITTTPAVVDLRRRMRETGAEVLIVDGVADTFAGNENARGDVKRYVNALLGIIPAGGALLLIAHVNKTAANSATTSEGYSGSTGWHNSVRSRWYLRPELAEGDDGGRAMPTGSLVLEVQKSNYGPVNASMRFVWNEEAHLFVGRHEPTGGMVQAIRERSERRGIMRALIACTDAGISVPRAMQGTRTAYLVLSQQPAFPDSLKGASNSAKRRFARLLESLRQIRHLEDVRIRRDNRHYTEGIVPTTEGRAECAE